jgi:hypothetical protein
MKSTQVARLVRAALPVTLKEEAGETAAGAGIADATVIGTPWKKNLSKSW